MIFEDKLTLLGAIQGTKTVRTTIGIGQELIAQKRDDRGRFVIKGGK